jgi:hypothetical protein
MLMLMGAPTRTENQLVDTYPPLPEELFHGARKNKQRQLYRLRKWNMLQAHATKQVLWHRYLFEALGFVQPEKSILWSDNQVAITISHNPEFHTRTKHIAITLHFLLDHVEAGTLELKHIPSRENFADIFTKRLLCKLHQDLTSKLGLLPVQGGVL